MGTIILQVLVLGFCIWYLLYKLEAIRANEKSMVIGIAFSFVGYVCSDFIFFWFSVFRRMHVLNIPLKFDSEVWMAAMIIIPVMTALPWIPAGAIIGLVSKKKGAVAGFKCFCILSGIIFLGLAFLFWNLPYN